LKTGSTGYIIPRIIPRLCRQSYGASPVVPGRAKDVAGKAIPSRIIPDHPGNINYFIPSEVECPMFPDVADRVTDVLQLFPVIPLSFSDHPRRLPGLCRDVSETVALDPFYQLLLETDK
jgi:hypothetical protein